MPDEVVAKETQDRKMQHINIILNENTQYREKTTMLELVDIKPKNGDVDPNSVDIETSIIGKGISAPLFISGMTGGHPVAMEINKNIAIAASRLGIPMGIGSQRAMLENESLAYTYDVKKFAKGLILIGNLGANRLPRYDNKRIQRMLNSVKADLIAVHTNPGQESVQPEGDIDFRGVYERIIDLAESISQPVIVKEVGNGISKEVARMFNKKIFAIDVQGAGGTTWIGVETFRSKGEYGNAFWDWGIPTALSILETKSAFNGQVWSSGGIRKPIDIVKSLAIGADMCGMAKPVIVSERNNGSDGVYSYFNEMINGVKIEMAGLGFSSLKELKRAKVSFKEPLKSILKERKVK